MEYREEFENHRAPLDREDRVLLEDIFLNGLKDEIKAEVKLHGYDDLAQLMDRALLLEEKNLALSKKSGSVKEKVEWKGSGSRFGSTWENVKDRRDGGTSSSTLVEKTDGKVIEGYKNRRLNAIRRGFVSNV